MSVWQKGYWLSMAVKDLHDCADTYTQKRNLRIKVEYLFAFVIHTDVFLKWPLQRILCLEMRILF